GRPPGRCPRRDRQPRAMQGQAACASLFSSEGVAASKNEGRAASELHATLHERDECAALHLDRRAAEQIQPRLRVGAAHAIYSNEFMDDAQPTDGVATERASRGHWETIRYVAIDLPIPHVIDEKEIVEHHDAIERGLGKERLERE